VVFFSTDINVSRPRNILKTISVIVHKYELKLRIISNALIIFHTFNNIKKKISTEGQLSYLPLQMDENKNLPPFLEVFTDRDRVGDTALLNQDPDEESEDVDSDDLMGSSQSSRDRLTGKYVGRDRNKKKRSSSSCRRKSTESSSS
jgi:hypothetical protein